ncbi:MAG: hypothetical protein LBR34_04890 [Prevotella sp.]|jgi:hypothetical protein|nr:hypothetical protein [Prevotella sp.]
MKKTCLLISVASMFSLTSCNGFLLEKVYFSTADQKYIDEHSFEIVTSSAAELVKLDEFSLKPETVDAIPVGTKLKILAMQGLSNEWGSQFTLKPYFIAETPDGSRSLVHCPEAYKGFPVKIEGSDEWQTVDKIVVEKTKNGATRWRYTVNGKSDVVPKQIDSEKMPRYNPQSIVGVVKKISPEKVEEQFVGKPLDDVEQAFTLADRITVNGNKQTAYFSGYKIETDSVYLSPLALRIENGVTTGIDWTNATVIDKSSKLYKFKTLLNVFSVFYSNNLQTLSSPRQWARSIAALEIVRPTGKWRIVISIILNIVLIISTFVFIFPWIVKKMFFYIKPLNNKVVIRLSRIVYVILTVWALFFFGLISPSLTTVAVLAFFAAAIRLGYTSIKDDAESDRCPYCNTVGEVYYVGKSDEKTFSSTRERTSSEYVADRKVTEYTNGRKTGGWTEGHYEKVTRKTRTINKHWKDNLHCNACGKDIVYSRYESDSNTWETGRRK